ncbi:thioesterase II family protein [Microbulbifer sp. 2205BS26-8]|uniref:thioesterase II family protein n=1 Tax=Microbulbifer sp. 2205BS26-8 TaxID=3064386 RepID=UPI00273DC853|nr:alpha/beta fold hydrolase [Microbulbifer sp. 2205BS26-8]MDP5210198.1 alpha/beta fold hydrolase [Microbulbifer sp. 2205BS26-8]
MDEWIEWNWVRLLNMDALLFQRDDIKSPSLRIFIFHHAGGSHFIYKSWVPFFPDNWDVCLVEYPGRGINAEHKLIDDIPLLAQRLLSQLTPYVDEPFIFFGHSMGALVAYEITQLLRDHHLPQPIWLGVSGRANPGFRPEFKRHLLADEALKRELYRLGGVPDSLDRFPDLWDTFLPLIRNDLKAVENWRGGSSHVKLSIPISTFCADCDPLISQHDIRKWKEFSCGNTCHHDFEGDHFYFFENEELLVSLIVKDVRASLLDTEKSTLAKDTKVWTAEIDSD